MKQRRENNRIWELDFFRGFAIIMVCWDHFMVDLSGFLYTFSELGLTQMIKLGEFASSYLYGDLRKFWWPVFIFVFFFTSGVCTTFSKSNLKRSLKILGVAFALTWFTYLFGKLFDDNSWFIFFGVLHCFGFVMLFYSLFEVGVNFSAKIVEKITKKPKNERLFDYIVGALLVGVAIAVAVVHAKYNVSLYKNGYVTTDSKFLGMFLFCANWATADYFPLVPYLGFFFLGAGFAKFFYRKKRSLLPSLDGKWNLPFTVAGRHSLLIYLLSQVAFFCLIALIVYIESGTFIFG